MRKNVLQTRLEAFAETIFIDLECFTNSLRNHYQKRFAKNATKQSAELNEINNKRFAEALKANRKHVTK